MAASCGRRSKRWRTRRHGTQSVAIDKAGNRSRKGRICTAVDTRGGIGGVSQCCGIDGERGGIPCGLLERVVAIVRTETGAVDGIEPALLAVPAGVLNKRAFVWTKTEYRHSQIRTPYPRGPDWGFHTHESWRLLCR